MRPGHACLLVFLTLGCTPQGSQPVSLTAFKTGPAIEGIAKAPSAVAAVAKYGLAALKDEVGLAESPIQLLDANDGFVRQGGKPVTTLTDKSGAYRFQGGFPTDAPVIVAAPIGGNRRVMALAVPSATTVRADLSVATTIVTAFLRDAARRDGRKLSAYDAEGLAALTALTERLIVEGEIAVPDLAVSAEPAMVRAYALAIGRDAGGLFDRWETELGRKVLALETIAGTGVAGGAADARLATEAELSRPRSVAANRAGHLFVADEGNDRVRRIDAKTRIASTYAGTPRGAFGGDGGPASAAQLNDPRAVALDDAGNLFVADLLNCRVRRVDAVTGVITTIAGNPAPDGTGGWVGGTGGDGAQAALAKLFAPRGLAFDPAGDLFVADSEADSVYHTIRKIDMKTGFISTAVGTPSAEGAFAGDGSRPELARLNYPNQIAFDPQGRLLIADTLNHCVRRADFAGKSMATVAGIGGQKGDDGDGRPADRTRIDTPYGVAVAPDGRIFFTERGKDRIRMVAPDGTLRTIAGGGTDAGDGEALGVKLDQPQDLYIEASGDLLVAEARGARIRRLILKHGL